MREFSPKTCESMGDYVYALVDPRDKKVFYIGKGKNNRVFDHAKGAIESDATTEKIETIKSILDEGKKVEHYVIRHGLDEQTAFEIESVLIDFLTYPHFNLETVMANIVAGHHQWDRGIKTTDEVEQTYAAEPIKINPEDKILCLNLNRTYKKGKNIYDITRGWWKLSKNRIKDVNVVLGIYGGIVRGVYKPEKWEVASDNNQRWGFTGIDVSNSPYMNKDTRGIIEFGSGNPVKYINC